MSRRTKYPNESLWTIGNSGTSSFQLNLTQVSSLPVGNTQGMCFGCLGTLSLLKTLLGWAYWEVSDLLVWGDIFHKPSNVQRSPVPTPPIGKRGFSPFLFHWGQLRFSVQGGGRGQEIKKCPLASRYATEWVCSWKKNIFICFLCLSTHLKGRFWGTQWPCTVCACAPPTCIAGATYPLCIGQ